MPHAHDASRRCQMPWLQRTQIAETISQFASLTNTGAGMLSGISQKGSLRSIIYCFTEFCNSKCLSHFAASFIVVWAETFIAERCVMHSKAMTIPFTCTISNKAKDSEAGASPHTPCPMSSVQKGNPPAQNRTQVYSQRLSSVRANDPSAGSPTETLLRLLLPLSDKVH